MTGHGNRSAEHLLIPRPVRLAAVNVWPARVSGQPTRLGTVAPATQGAGKEMNARGHTMAPPSGMASNYPARCRRKKPTVRFHAKPAAASL